MKIPIHIGLFPPDPTNKQKIKLINVLKRIKSKAEIDDNIFRKMYPTGISSPKLYRCPKILTNSTQLRATVSSRGSVTYGVAKELVRILKPLTGSTIHHLSTTKEFADETKKIIKVNIFNKITGKNVFLQTWRSWPVGQ